MSDRTSQNILSSSYTGYMPQLDTLRTFAVMQVLFSHWLMNNPYFKSFPFGETGVILFFVLSGFLITQILLKSRDAAERRNQNRFHSLKQFYIRRTLRIFPIYYITIFILFVLNTPTIRENFLWYLFYASNILYFDTQSWGASLSHLWTLAVEEQFYIICPFVILFIPRKYLLKSIIGIILIGPIFRAILFTILAGSQKAFFINVLTPSCMDCFGLGALLAYYRIKNIKAFEFKSIFSKAFVLINFLLMIMFVFYINQLLTIISPIYMRIIYQTLLRLNISIISLFLIAKASVGFTGFLKIIFENKVLIYLGKISYGLYLFHNFIPKIYTGLGLPLTRSQYMNFLIQLILLVIVSSISWYIIEKPINNLKKYFSYN